MPEWSKGSVSKTASQNIVSSNLTAGAIFINRLDYFTGRMSALQAEGVCSIQTSSIYLWVVSLTVEQEAFNLKVLGSNPRRPTIVYTDT